jgi:hypothetical protein
MGTTIPIDGGTLAYEVAGTGPWKKLFAIRKNRACGTALLTFLRC